MVDKVLIERKLALLRERRELLKVYKLRTYAQFLDGPYQKAVEKVLQEMVEICLDIGKHLIADEGLPLATDSKEIFQILHRHKILSKRMSHMMMDMVGFRNFIVHVYEKIDPEIVYGVYCQHLPDFDRFARAITRYIGA
ncbi:MAG: DUF86 domain-containing protein [Deltaproteobacteria bacterium]|nr:DUF86 domain-containing protein [Deltaproteobacteria bacterium]